MGKLDELGDAFYEQPPDRSPRGPKRKSWQPKLGPIGTQVLMNQTAETIFMYGERGSLKSGVLVHMVIRHCYQDHLPSKLPPLAVMCTIVRSAATEGGTWDKMHSLYLPEWYDGIGLEFTPPKSDDVKQKYFFIGTQYGDWARVILKSIPFGESIRSRIKGIEPSLFSFDEITETDDPDYYLIPSQALRRPTGGPRFFICAGNPPPEGIDHWTWRVMCRTGGTDKEGKPTLSDGAPPNGGGLLTGTPPKISVYHMPLSENVYWSDQEKADYRAKLMQEARLDPTAEDRLIKGLWTPRPRGHGLFKDYFVPSIHIKPAEGLIKGLGLLPIAGHPIIVGYDLGQVYNSVTFEQRLPLADKVIWTAIDEIDYLGERVLYRLLARKIVHRMKHWRSIALPSNRGNPYAFNFIHIADESALNQWRPGGEGGYDAWEFEQEFKIAAAIENMKPAKLIGCPKPAGSVGARVMLLQSKLYHEEFFISAQCPNITKMLLNLEAEKDDPDKPRRNKWLHKFDSLTYPMLKMEATGGKVFGANIGNTHSAGLIKCGTA